ncbi:MAG: CoA transferase [Dehalococcoidia bacterium]
MQRWGLDYDSLRDQPRHHRRQHAGLRASPDRAATTALGNYLGAAIGLSSMTGYPDRPPVSISVVAFFDHGCNLFHALTATMAAVIYRERAGGGQSIMVPQYESTACFLGPALLDYTVNGRVDARRQRPPVRRAARCLPLPARTGRRDRWVAIGGIHRTAVARPVRRDGAIVAGRRPALRHAGGAPAPPRHLDAAIEAWTAGQDACAVMERFQVAGVPAEWWRVRAT